MDKKKYSVIAKNISKGYKLYSSPKQKLLDLILPKGAGKTFYALKDISFKVEKGDVVGLVGLNGSGKSTLSNILGGISMPTKGSIKINGESSLIAIGLGLNNFLTGMENIELKSIMMGYKREEIEKIKQDIIDFADIGEFINQPLRTYSSGMRSRLGFAISVYTDPDILVIDEALSVGDPTFTQKCLDKMNEFKERGKTIFFVSHSVGQIKQFCNKALWLEYGRLKDFGDVDEILPQYQEYINFINKMSEEEKEAYKKSVLEESNHSLLEQFKIIDPSLKEVSAEGNIIKTVKLINAKRKIKKVFYNFDIFTALFGCIPSFIRKEGKCGIILLLIQLINGFIVSFPYGLLTNFIITILAAFLTGKIYVDNLIDNGEYVPYNIWAKNHDEIEYNEVINNKRINKEKKKFNLGIVAITFAIATLLGISIYFIKDKIISPDNKKITTNIVKNNKAHNLRDYVVVDTFTEGTEIKIKNIVVLSSDENNNIVGNLFPGELQVGVDGEYDRLNNIVNIKDISKLKSILKKNFNIEMNEYSIVSTNGKNEAIEYQTLLSDVLANTEEDCKTKINEVLVDSNKISNKKLKTFYNTYHEKTITIEPIIYETISINDVLNANIRATVDMANYKDYVFLVCDRSVLDKNKVVKALKKEYDSKKANTNTVEDDDNDDRNNTNNNRSYSDRNYGGGINYGTTGGTGSTTDRGTEGSVGGNVGDNAGQDTGSPEGGAAGGNDGNQGGGPGAAVGGNDGNQGGGPGGATGGDDGNQGGTEGGNNDGPITSGQNDKVKVE